MIIYGFPTFNLTKVLLTAEELELDYQYVALDAAKGEHKSPEHLKRNPLGKVPVLEDKGFLLTESAAICRYLARTQGGKLYAGDTMQKAIIDQWMDFATQHVGKALTTYFYEEVVKVQFFGEVVSQQELDKAQTQLDLELPFVEQRLQASAFLAAEELTLADIVAFAYFNVEAVTSLSFSQYPYIHAWYEKIGARPACRAAMRHFPGGHIFGRAKPVEH